MKEYRKALKQLTLGYILAIFVACAFFTVPVIIFANNRIDESARFSQNAVTFEERLEKAPPEVRERVMNHATNGKTRLLRTTIIFDSILLILGAVASYFFARKTLAPLEEAHQAQERFAADASHELRTPLAIMQTELEVALKANKNRSQLQKTVKDTLGEVRSLSLLTDKLLQLTKTGSAEIDTTTLDLADFLTSTLGQFEKKYDIQIKRDISDSLTITANEALLQQLLTIIIDNAVRYAGDRPPEVSSTTEQTSNGVRLQIADKGIGISKADLPHVFDRLYRGTNVTNADGHGLGLSLAKSITDLHGWQLTITSELGKGTTASIVFPVQKT